MRTGVYARGNVHATMSPAMDIQVASNFERLIFEAHGRDPAVTRALLAEFSATRSLTLKPAALAKMQQTFAAVRVDESETVATMKAVHRETGRLVDPHTAVGLTAARAAASGEDVVALATAHPANFPTRWKWRPASNRNFPSASSGS